MLRPPAVNPERDRRIARLEEKLAELQAIPEPLRAAEFVAEKEAAIREVIESLRQK